MTKPGEKGMTFEIGGKRLGDGTPCFITLEAGPTHDGVDSAIRLAKMAAAAGGDAIKFQILDPDRLVADRKALFRYDVLVDRATGRSETVEEPLYDILCRRALSKDQWLVVKKACDDLGLAFFATIGFPDEVDLVQSMGCHSIKIASGDINHFPLIRRAAKTGLCIQIDTGSSSLGEVEAAVDVIQSEGNNNIVIHHCPSGYPARATGINLRIITTLKQMFPFPIAFSDHSPGHDMDVAALAMGANLLEKTITEDRTTRSVEHLFSLEQEEARHFVDTMRLIELALGNPLRKMHPDELVNRKRVRRSAYLRKNAKMGSQLSAADVDFRRPCIGISPDQYEQLVGHVLVRDMAAGAVITASDLAQPETK